MTFENVPSATTKQSDKRKCLIYKRKVNGIKSSLDESNYNPFIVPAETVKILAELPWKTTTNKKAKEKIVFTNQPNAVAKSSDCSSHTPCVTSSSS